MHTSSESGQTPGRYEDEITLQEVIYSLAHIIGWVKGHAIRLGFFIVLGGSIGAFWAYRQPPVFVADLTFMLNDENNPQISGVGGILGQLGLPVPSGKYNVDKLLEIAKSRSLMESSLLGLAEVDGHLDFLANHFITIYDLDDDWSAMNEEYQGFLFDSGDQSAFGNLEHFALKSLSQKIAGSKQNRSGALFSTDYGKTDYIMNFSIKSLSEDLSIKFVNELYDQVSKFYIDKSIEKNQSIYNLILAKKDSISRIIKDLAFEIADLKDKGSGSFRNKNSVDIALLESRLSGMQTASEEVIKNLSRAQYALETNTPLIQYLDRPVAPLSPQKPSIIKYGILGVVVGLIAYLLTLLAIQIFRQVQSNSLSIKNT